MPGREQGQALTTDGTDKIEAVSSFRSAAVQKFSSDLIETTFLSSCCDGDLLQSVLRVNFEHNSVLHLWKTTYSI